MVAPPEESLPVEHPWLDRLPLPAGIIRRGRYVFANAALLELLGRSKEQVLGLRFDEPVAPEDRERVAERHAMRQRGEPVPSSYEFEVVRPSGERRRVEIWVSTLGPDTLIQAQDVTEREVRQRHLRALVGLGAAVQREQRAADIFRAVALGLEALGAGVVRLAPDGDGVRVTEVSAPAGLTAALEGALGRGWLRARRPWGPSLRRAWDQGFAYLDDLPLSVVRFLGEAYARPLREVTSSSRWSRGALLRVDEAGRPCQLLLVMAGWILPEDQAALALFAAQVSAALDAARVITDLSRRNAELAALNRVATAAGTSRELGELFERASREVVEVLRSAAVALYLVEEGASFARLAHVYGGSEEVNRTLARVPLQGTQLGQVARSGQPHTLRVADYPPDRQALLRRLGQEQVVSVPLLSRGRAVGVMNVAFTTEREVAPQELELLLALAAHLAAAVEANRLVEDLRTSYVDLSLAQAQLVQRERLAAIGEMAAVVAHEVRNPLGVIFNALSSTQKGLASGQEVGPLLGILNEEAERINHLVSDLLDFARPTQPRLTPGVSLRAVVEEAVEAALAEAPAPVAVDLRGGEGLERVALDERLMRQVFLNLALNALQAMPQGGRLEVALGTQAGAQGPQAVVEFRDSGAGIPAEVLPRIFEPFFTTRARGTGLGLALVKRIVEGHRGEVAVHSQAGRGACFAVRWPLAGA